MLFISIALICLQLQCLLNLYEMHQIRKDMEEEINNRVIAALITYMDLHGEIKKD